MARNCKGKVDENKSGLRRLHSLRSYYANNPFNLH